MVTWPLTNSSGKGDLSAFPDGAGALQRPADVSEQPFFLTLRTVLLRHNFYALILDPHSRANHSKPIPSSCPISH